MVVEMKNRNNAGNGWHGGRALGLLGKEFASFVKEYSSMFKCYRKDNTEKAWQYLCGLDTGGQTEYGADGGTGGGFGLL